MASFLTRFARKKTSQYEKPICRDRKYVAILQRNYIKTFKRTVLDRCLWTIQSVWSKTTLITCGVGGVTKAAGTDPPICKIETFF